MAQLQKGLDLLAGLPDSPWRREHELELRIALGQALIGAKGYAAPAVGEVFARAHVLAVQLNRSDHIVPLLWGQWTFHLARSELRLALSLAERIEQIGEVEDNVVLRLLGHRVHGMTRFHLGEFVAARALFARCHGLNDPAHRAVDAVLSAEDPYAVVLAYLAQTLTALGCLDQGRARINEALREARRLGHVHTLVHVLRRAALIELATGSPHETQRYAEEMVAISTEHGFAYWFAYGMVSRGSALTALGQAQEGLHLITQGLSMARATGAIIATP